MYYLHKDSGLVVNVRVVKDGLQTDGRQRCHLVDDSGLELDVEGYKGRVRVRSTIKPMILKKAKK